MCAAPEVAGDAAPPAKRPRAAEPAPAAGLPLQVKRLSAAARLPTRGSVLAAGYDLYAARACVVPARGKALVETDISIAVPDGTCAFSGPPFASPPAAAN